MEFKVYSDFDIGDVICPKSSKKIKATVKDIVLVYSYFSYHFEYCIEFSGNRQVWINSIDIRQYELDTQN